MLTGDNENVANKIAKELGIDKVYSNLLPNEKVDRLEEIFKNIGIVVGMLILVYGIYFIATDVQFTRNIEEIR